MQSIELLLGRNGLSANAITVPLRVNSVVSLGTEAKVAVSIAFLSSANIVHTLNCRLNLYE